MSRSRLERFNLSFEYDLTLGEAKKQTKLRLTRQLVKHGTDK